MVIGNQGTVKSPVNHQKLGGKLSSKNGSFLNVFSKKNSNAMGSTQGGTGRNSSKNSTMQMKGLVGRHFMQDVETRGDSFI